MSDTLNVMTPRLLKVVLFCAFLLTSGLISSLTAQEAGRDIVLNVRSDTTGHPAREEPRLLNGYRSTVSGQTIPYHSAHPDADAALLVRANSEAHSASWLTDTIPASSADSVVNFIWLAGLERSGWGESKSGHPFTLFINGERWFTFRNYKDSTASHWSVQGRDGAHLAFIAHMADRFGDQFGSMYLTLPRKVFPEGKPLLLEVVGEDANSPEWYMTFQYTFNFVPQVRVEPALFREISGATQVLRLSLDNLVGGRTMEILSPAGIARREPLKIGANIFMLPMPAVDSIRPCSLVFQIDGQEVVRQRFQLKPVIRRDVYLLSHSHNDIGYTDLQPEVERMQWRNIDEALRLIEATRDYPADARFRWNIEVLWPLESYLRRATPERRARLIDAIRSGSIGVNALYGNELTGLATSVEMSHFVEYARAFSREYAIPITTALVSDIPGFTWGIVPALAQSGVKYFASGPNSGDRIGFVLEQWGDKPFYWSSQSGREKVLFWVAGAGYSTFHEGTLDKLGNEKIMKLMRKLDDSGYPYEIVHLPYTLGDNGPPDSTLPDFVRRWNTTYLSPRLILATHERMFTEFEQRYGKSLPVYSGDFTPYWEDGALSTAYETALNRQAVDRLVAGEAVWSIRAPNAFPREEYGKAWRDVVLYDEHTWGASNSVSEPDDAGVKGQWRIKQHFALEADSLSRALLTTSLALSRNENAPSDAIDVYNPTAWERTGLVTVTAEMSRRGDRVFDQHGRPVASQRLSTGELAFLAEHVPPMSAARYIVKDGKTRNNATRDTSVMSLENGSIGLRINPKTGAIEEFTWKGGDDVATLGRGLNQFLYVPGTNPDSAETLANVRVKVKETGPLVRSLFIEGDAPGCRQYSTEVRLIEGRDQVEITTTIDKQPIRNKEAVHIAFPFSVPEATVRYDVASAIVRPEADQLAGACKNFFSVQSWVDVSNTNWGVTLATPDAPLVEIGGITAERPWMTHVLPSAVIYSYVMNNYWHTNYKADQEGVVVLHYVLLPHSGYKPEEAARFGMECRAPFIACPADPRPPPQPLFRVEPAGVLVASIKPLPGGWLLYAYNATDEDQQLRILWNRQVRILSSDAAGSRGSLIRNELPLAAHGSTYLRVERR
jgi:hypothetical protein